jgi:hypothetical protein
LLSTFVVALLGGPQQMLHDPRFGPSAQTPAQRALVLARMQQTAPSLKDKATPYARQLYARYVTGELSWSQVRQALDEAMSQTDEV